VAYEGLTVEGLSAERAGVQVLSNVSFEVKAGTTLALLGANGAGKSTTVDAICGFAKKRSGRVLLGDRDITRLSPHEIARLGLIQVSQGRDLFPDMTVHENLLLGEIAARGRGGSVTRSEVYSSFPVLADRSNQRAGSLSGGEQQMLAIARALLSEPKVLLLDEPTSGLAPIIVEQVVDSVKDLAQRGLTLLLVEQNVEVALRSADRVGVLRRGERVFYGDRTELGGDYRDVLHQLYV
jgi:branched-chain amino acid transport system ATP-binding protein